MCYFLNVDVKAQRREPEAQTVVERLARDYGLHLRGEFPVIQITDGHCSCHQVATDGHSIRIVAFVRELAGSEEVKYIRVGWTWATGQNVQMPPGALERRLSIQDFIAHNADKKLRPDLWYRLNDPDRYKR